MKTLNILVLVAVLFVATVSVTFACDPRYGKCPPPSVYNPPTYPNSGTWASEWNYAVQRTQYDVNYAVDQAQHSWNKAQGLGRHMWTGAQTYPYGTFGQ